MVYSRTVSCENKSTLLDFLKSRQESSDDIDIAVSKNASLGLLQVRGGRAVAAEWAGMSGNGAFLSMLVTPGVGYETQTPRSLVVGRLTLTVSTAERLLKTLQNAFHEADSVNEEEKLQQAIHLFYQFRRKEAGVLLVEILRTNRFYYPAWLWHSRLMTKGEYIRKALNEAKKWGNCDADIQQEAARIESQLVGSEDSVKRCIFCCSVVKQSDQQCAHCQGMLQISGNCPPSSTAGSSTLEKAVAAYKQEFSSCPANPRIAYCLCLGFYSLGRIDQAREYVDKALQIAANEPLFARARAFLARSEGKPVVAAKPMSTVETAAAAISPSQSLDKTILVVEDSQTSRKVITMLLARKGYVVQEAKNGAEALAMLSEGAPDLVLLDLMLPDMSGYDILAQVRHSTKTADIPVIMLTGKSNPADRMKGLHHGSNEYLTKPFNPEKLLVALEKYLGHQMPKNKENISAKPKVSRAVPQVQKSLTPPPKPVQVAPVAPAAPVAVRKAPAVQAAPTGGAAKKLVLVVEDSPTSRKVISMVIAKRGYTVNEAATGAVAIRKAHEATPDLILLDAMLPDMSGYDILHRFKSENLLKDVPVVMLTAKTSPVDRQKGLKGGSAAYLTKPFDPEKLLAVIDEFIR